MNIVIQNTKIRPSESVDPDSFITFQGGILGFPFIKNYLLIEHEKGQAFFWLQAAKDPDLAFFIVDPLILKPDYQPNLPPLDLLSLGIEDAKSMKLLSIVTVPKDGSLALTANLMAPLIINHQLRRGEQIVLNDSGYRIREPIINFENP